MRKFCAFLVFCSIIFAAFVMITDYYGNPLIFALTNEVTGRYVRENYDGILHFDGTVYEKDQGRYVGLAYDYYGDVYIFEYFPDGNYIYDGYYDDSLAVYKMSMRENIMKIVNRNCDLNGKIEDAAVKNISLDRFVYKIGDLTDHEIPLSISIRLNGNLERNEFSQDAYQIANTLSNAYKNLDVIRIISENNTETYEYRFYGGLSPYDFKAAEERIITKKSDIKTVLE